MTQIVNGSIVTYVGSWPGAIGGLPNFLVDPVVTDLTNAGIISRSPAKVDSGLTGPLTGAPFTVTLQLQIENQGYASEDDLISVIRHWVYQEAGNFPESDSIPFVQTPDGTTHNTGQPSPPGSGQPSGCIAGTSHDLTDSFSFSCWFKNLTTQGLSTVGLLAVVVIVGVGVALFAGFRPK